MLAHFDPGGAALHLLGRRAAHPRPQPQPAGDAEHVGHVLAARRAGLSQLPAQDLGGAGAAD